VRILVCTTLGSEGNARHRVTAMARLGHDVTEIDTDAILTTGSRVANWLRVRTQRGPSVDALNRRMVDAATSGPPFDVIWCDKPVLLRVDTVRRLRATGARVVSFNSDNPFGTRGDAGWGLFLKTIPEYDVHLVNTAACIDDYRQRGARHVFAMPPFFEPAVHFPPPEGWSEDDRDIDVSFVGSPYDDRPDFIRAPRRDFGITVRLFGARWDRVLTTEEQKLFQLGPASYGEDYRRLIWRSKISLGFVTHANCDTYARRWFEITGCGGFLLGEATADGRASFDDGEEAVFFTGAAECAEAIRRYLPDADARRRIAAAGHSRATTSGYDTQSRIAVALTQVMEATA
jgi:spore maturation protein CgeB